MERNPKRRTTHLTSVGRVGTEIGRIYRMAFRGEIETVEAYRLTQVLLGLKSCLESATLEQRIANLEAQADSGTVEHFRPRAVS